MSDHREVAVEVTVAAPIEVVWRALRERGEIRRWHGWEDPSLDAEIEQIFFTDAVEEVPAGPDRRLDCGGSVFEVTARGAQTQVTVVMVRPPEDESWHGWYEDVREGWLTFVQQLRFALERHPGADRRTVFVSGTASEVAGPIELLGLSGVGAPGTPYAAGLPTGDDIAGEVWFRSAGQLGVTVAGWGDGLLIVSELHPVGAVLSTYGTDPGELARRWETWWGEHFPTA